MKKIFLVSLLAVASLYIYFALDKSDRDSFGAPPYGEPESAAPDESPYSFLKNWVRPEGPPKVALQVGHLDNEDFPEELAKLRNNDGASGGGKSEAEVNLKVAEEIKPILEKEGIVVEILPATVPQNYYADVFLAIHSDGSTNASKSGYKFASPWRDFSGKSNDLVLLLEKEYQEETDFEKDPNVTRNMRGYYAFSWWRYEHAIHPMTTAVIAEIGFLTSRVDRKVIVDQPDKVAAPIAKSIITFLKEHKELL